MSGTAYEVLMKQTDKLQDGELLSHETEYKVRVFESGECME